ncbi:hypothetical protein N7527_008743 [Penicillium freii]|nr:hypothetical protein N7527_008743 [Penicillium freii]
MAFKYPQFEPYGDKLMRWMESANEPGCPVLRSTLTPWTLPQPILWHSEHEREWLSPEQVACIVGSGLPLGQLIPNDMYPTKPPCLRQSIIKTRGGVTGRRSASNDPHVSELAKIAYETHFPLESVKHVIVNEVQENATEPFIEEHIYPSREGLIYPSAEPQTWDYATPEFRAIMGTPIGKVVGSFILGAFGQGVKRVSRIVTFQRGLELHKLDIRFDIEDV